jgi:hypothetical protein
VHHLHDDIRIYDVAMAFFFCFPMLNVFVPPGTTTTIQDAVIYITYDPSIVLHIYRRAVGYIYDFARDESDM